MTDRDILNKECGLLFPNSKLLAESRQAVPDKWGAVHYCLVADEIRSSPFAFVEIAPQAKYVRLIGVTLFYFSGNNDCRVAAMALLEDPNAILEVLICDPNAQFVKTLGQRTQDHLSQSIARFDSWLKSNSSLKRTRVFLTSEPMQNSAMFVDHSEAAPFKGKVILTPYLVDVQRAATRFQFALTQNGHSKAYSEIWESCESLIKNAKPRKQPPPPPRMGNLPSR